jgi:hypothetical protein
MALVYNSLHTSDEHCGLKSVFGEHPFPHEFKARPHLVADVLGKDDVLKKGVLIRKFVLEPETLVEQDPFAVINPH